MEDHTGEGHGLTAGVARLDVLLDESRHFAWTLNDAWATTRHRSSLYTAGLFSRHYNAPVLYPRVGDLGCLLGALVGRWPVDRVNSGL